jgi:hypothetical protein
MKGWKHRLKFKPRKPYDALNWKEKTPSVAAEAAEKSSKELMNATKVPTLNVGPKSILEPASEPHASSRSPEKLP